MSQRDSGSDCSYVQVSGGDSVTSDDSYVKVGDEDSGSSSDGSSYVHVNGAGSSGLSVDLDAMGIEGGELLSDFETETTTGEIKPADSGADDARATAQSANEDRTTSSGVPPKRLMFEGTFEQAVSSARDEKKLLLVTLLDDDGRGPFGASQGNPDVFGPEQFVFLSERYVFYELPAGTKAGAKYAGHYRVEKFPHLGILHPIHRTMLWGADGGSEEHPWEPNSAMEELVYWGFASFTRDHFERVAEEKVREKKKPTKQPASKKARSAKHFVWPPRKAQPAKRKSSRALPPEVLRRVVEEKEEVDTTVENRLTEEYLLQEAVDQELLLQQAMTTGIDVDDPEELANFVEVQSLMFASN